VAKETGGLILTRRPADVAVAIRLSRDVQDPPNLFWAFGYNTARSPSRPRGSSTRSSPPPRWRCPACRSSRTPRP
jgi:hypothetical protein